MTNAPVYARVGRKVKNGQRVLSNAQKSAVSKIAKKVLVRTAETQSYIKDQVQTLNNDSLYVHNLCGQIVQGTSSEQRVGEKILLKSFHIRMQLTQLNSTTVSNEGSTFRVMIIATKEKFTPTSGIISSSEVFRGSTINLANRGHIDLHRHDVLYDKIVPFEVVSQLSTNTSKSLIIKMKVNKTKIYETDGGNYFKDKQLYLVYTQTKTDPSIVGISGVTSYQFTTNFKDI